MRLNRFACLSLFAAFFTCFAIVPQNCIAKEKKPGTATSKIEKHYWRHGKPPYRPYRPYQGPVWPSNGAPPVLQGATSGTFGPSGSGGDIQINPNITANGFQHTASPMIAMPAPTLQGATNGTIGPPSSPVPLTFAPALPGVSVDPSQKIPTQKETPIIPTLLFASLAFSLMFVGIRSIIFKKRAPLFVLGLISAGALMLVGFMLSFYEPAKPVAAARIAAEPMPPEPIAVQPIVVEPEVLDCELDPEKFTPPPNSSPGAATATSVVEIPD